MQNRSSSSVFAIILVIAVGLMAGIFSLGMGGDNWSPRNYVARDGECFVPPQGDPLYDQHYAQQVNPYNCDALKVQSQSKYIDSQTEAIRVNTREGLFGVVVTFGAVAGMLLLLIVAMVRSQGGGQ